MRNFRIRWLFQIYREKIEIKGKSLVTILSEYLNSDNKLKNYVEKNEAKDLLQKIDKYKNNLSSGEFQSKIKNYVGLDIDAIKKDILGSKDKLQEMDDKINSEISQKLRELQKKKKWRI